MDELCDTREQLCAEQGIMDFEHVNNIALLTRLGYSFDNSGLEKPRDGVDMREKRPLNGRWKH